MTTAGIGRRLQRRRKLAPLDRRNWLERQARQGETVGRRTYNERRISGIADRRRQIHEDLAALYHRRGSDCTATCVHAQEQAP